LFDESCYPAGRGKIIGNTNCKGCEYGLKEKLPFVGLLALISLLVGCASTPQELRSTPRESSTFHLDVPYHEARFHILNRLGKCFVGGTNATYFFPKVRDDKPEQSMSFDIYEGGIATQVLLSADIARNPTGGTDLHYFVGHFGVFTDIRAEIASWATGTNTPCGDKAITNRKDTSVIATTDPLVSINLVFDSVTVDTSAQVERMANHVRSSGLFSKVDIAGRQWAYTVVLRYGINRPETDKSAADIVQGLAAAATLFVVPHPDRQTQALDAAVLLNGMVVQTFSYHEDVNVQTGVLKRSTDIQMTEIADRLLDRFLAEIVAAKVLPRKSELEPAAGETVKAN
jgi:hypothetical protein